MKTEKIRQTMQGKALNIAIFRVCDRFSNLNNRPL